MNQKRFKEILTKFVVYLYPNIKILNEVEFEDKEYAVLLDNGTINCKGDINSNKGFTISIDSIFLPNDANLLNNFISEIYLIESYEDLKSEYVETLITTALNTAIARTLSNKSYKIISKVINGLSRYSERTYEGRNIQYGVIISDKLESEKKISNTNFDSFISNPSSAVLTNGTESFIEVDSEGYVIRYLQLNSEKNEYGLAPYNYTRILEYCGEDNTGIVLSQKGEILIFHDNEIKYTKRGGRWNPYSHKETIRLIHERSENDNLLFAKAVYLTALDISFSTTGGIISFLNENEVQNALRHINIKDIVNEKYFEIKKKQMIDEKDYDWQSIKDVSFQDYLKQTYNGKSCVLERLIDNRKFFMLYRKLRQELVSIDGATIIDYNGDIVALGAIVKIEAGSMGGGRLAAAKTLSQYGISIEISSDASIKGYALDMNNNPEVIFSISDYI